MPLKKIIIGARGSDLSLIQTYIVRDLLKPLVPDTKIEIITIQTSGDKNMSPIPLDTIGKGWFTKEIDRQLLDGKIDIAVHSLKDLLDTLTPGLAITAIPEREDPAEVLVSHNNVTLHKLKKGAVIGTDSIRRKIQLLQIRPDLIVKSVRGNVNKRLAKLDAGDYDGLILAFAGIKRLGFEERIAEYFDAKDFIPSPGQGALAVVSNVKNTVLNHILVQLNDTKTVIAVTAERAFSAATGGGCSMPVGAYAEIRGEEITLYGMLGSEAGQDLVKGSLSGSISDPKGLAKRLAKKLLAEAGPWYRRETIDSIEKKPKYIVLTREETENNIFAKQLTSLGFTPLSCPSIAIKPNLSVQKAKPYLSKLSDCDWLIFTSSNGVNYFVDILEKSGMDVSVLSHTRVAAVGSKTADAAKTAGLTVSLIPEKFTAENLGQAMPDIKGKHILHPRSTLANPKLQAQLEKKGATVTTMPVYKTELVSKPNHTLPKLVKTNAIRCLTFTSPSTIEGFLKNIDSDLLPTILSIPVLSIGPVTTKAAKQQGFRKISTADTHTIEGMLTKLKENIL